LSGVTLTKENINDEIKKTKKLIKSLEQEATKGDALKKLLDHTLDYERAVEKLKVLNFLNRNFQKI